MSDALKKDHTYCGAERRFEGVETKSTDEATLPNARISNKYHLKQTLHLGVLWKLSLQE